MQRDVILKVCTVYIHSLTGLSWFICVLSYPCLQLQAGRSETSRFKSCKGARPPAFSHVRHWEVNFEGVAKSSLQLQLWKIVTLVYNLRYLHHNIKMTNVLAASDCATVNLWLQISPLFSGSQKKTWPQRCMSILVHRWIIPTFWSKKQPALPMLQERSAFHSQDLGYFPEFPGDREKQRKSRPAFSWKHAIDRLITWQARSWESFFFPRVIGCFSPFATLCYIICIQKSTTGTMSNAVHLWGSDAKQVTEEHVWYKALEKNTFQPNFYVPWPRNRKRHEEFLARFP